MDETTQMLKNLGRRIAYLRKQQGMSQEDFAEASGKMINTISNIERGLSDPKISTLVSISNALNTSIEELVSNITKDIFSDNNELLPNMEVFLPFILDEERFNYDSEKIKKKIKN